MDISNLNTKDNPETYLDYYRQETVISAKNVFAAAINALNIQPSLKKVVIMAQTPRYDPLDTDPLSLKPVLAQLFNTTLTDQWMTCAQRNKIFIGAHNIDCTGAIREARYRDTKSGRFDGLHLIGASGPKFYTLSVLNILRAAKLTSEEYEFHQSCPQTQNRRRKQPTNNKNNKETNRTEPQTASSQSQPRYYSMPTQNRFQAFSSTNQGNW